MARRDERAHGRTQRQRLSGTRTGETRGRD